MRARFAARLDSRDEVVVNNGSRTALSLAPPKS